MNAALLNRDPGIGRFLDPDLRRTTTGCPLRKRSGVRLALRRVRGTSWKAADHLDQPLAFHGRISTEHCY